MSIVFVKAEGRRSWHQWSSLSQEG